MARIGRQVLHFDQIDVNSIQAEFSDNKSHRYNLEMCYRDDLYSEKRNKSIVVILKNPSSADEKKADSTIRKVETYVYHKFSDVKYLRILNIFSIRGTDPLDINILLKEKGYDYIVGQENNMFFKKTLLKSDYIICAWGGNSGIDKEKYKFRISEVIKMIKNTGNKPAWQVCGKQITKEPLHGLMWGYDYLLKKLNLSDTTTA